MKTIRMRPPTCTRRDFVKALGVGTLGLSLPACALMPSSTRSKPTERRVYVGTYTSGQSEGIYRYRLDLATGALLPDGLVARTENPSFLAVDPRRRFLYAVNELVVFGGAASGAVSAFAIDPATGDLTLLNQQPTQGGAPCHLSVDQTGRWVLVANYVGGNLAVFPVEADGRLGAATDVAQHVGRGVHPERQEAPHAHAIILDPANRYVFAADLGIDRVMAYRLDAEQGRLIPNAVPWASVEAGAGPRHVTFHPNGRYAYVINELNATLTAFAYDAAHGTLQAVQTVPTLPDGYTGVNQCADVHVAPDGRFLYGSNRGHDSIVIFAIDAQTGRLSLVGHEPTQGRWPRNFVLDSTGTFLLVANERSDTIVTFRIDRQTGGLTPTGHVAEAPAPVCLKIMAA